MSRPFQVGIQSNLSEYLLPPRGSVNKHHPTAQSTVANKADNDSFLDPAASSASSASQQPSIFSVAAASASRSSATSGGSSSSSSTAAGNKASSSSSAAPQQIISNTNPLLQPRKPDGLHGSRSAGRQGSDMETTSSPDSASSSSLAVSQQAMFR